MIGEAACYGSCADFYSAYDGGPNSGYFTQVAGSGSETHSVINPDGSITPLEDTSQLSNGSTMMNPLQIEAPAYQWVFAGGFNFAALGSALVPYNPAVAVGQTLGFGITGAAGMAVKLPSAVLGAIYGGIGGYQARGWGGVLPGSGVGAVTGGLGGLAGDWLLANGYTGLWGVGGTMLTGSLSGAASAYSVNYMTGNPNLSQGVLSATLIGGFAPLMSGEAMAAGGAGIGGIAAYSLNAASGAAAVGLTGAVGP